MTGTFHLGVPSVFQPTAVRFVSAEATRAVLRWPETIARLRDAYAVPHAAHACPPRTVAREGGAWMRSLLAIPPGSRLMGAKLFGMGRERTVGYLIALFDQQTAAVVGLLDAAYVTAFRTAATSAVAVDCLAPREPVALGVLGSGLEARTHVEAIAAVRPIRSLRVFSPREERRKAFAAEFAEQLGIRAEAVASAQEAVTGATLVLAAARSYDETPVLHGAWLSEGMLVVSIGSTLPEQREIDAELVARCDAIVCDAVDEVVEETGDMLAARAAGVVFEQKLVSLNAVVTGDARKLVSKARLPMYKSVGAAIQDVVVAEHAFELAVAAGLAAPLPTEFTSKPT